MRSTLAAMHIKCDALKVPGRNGTATMQTLSGSASIKGKTLTVTLTNPSVESSVATRIRLTGGSLVDAQGRVLTHPEMTAKNTFDHPDEVKSSALPVNVRGDRAEVSLPPRSVAALELRIS
jgi:alpha-N-arabinofuranosidase